jgi:hypothetical protein
MENSNQEIESLRQQNLELLKRLDEANKKIIQIEKEMPSNLPRTPIRRQNIPPLPKNI